MCLSAEAPGDEPGEPGSMPLPMVVYPTAGEALVVGGGRVAARKVCRLVEAGFRVRVVAPDIAAEIVGQPGVEAIRARFSPELFGAPVLAFACTSDRAVNAQVGQLARQRGVLVLVADRAGECTFSSPAVLREGPLTIAVSTGGADPAAAREARDRIAGLLEGAARRNS